METNRSESILGLVVYSPVVYLVIFIFSYFIHLRYPIAIIRTDLLLPLGLLLIFIAPLLIVWAQRELSSFRRELAGGPRFHRGPYRFSRNPTYLGLALLTFGFSCVVNSLPLLLGSLVAFIAVNLFIVPKEEELMHKKYGDHYAQYRSKVRRWL
ncbi:isoprenylcysteine carboxylmethyltransferase family protein [Candidatus Parcubacteria bacterium]|nr:isoprenylcysteine carboxylmethyltransferase family protein [Candidatus Parcubacteria bacterium]